MPRKLKEATCTTRVLEALRSRDDFTDSLLLRSLTGCSLNQISAACTHLRKYRVIDVVIEPDGRAWWFALPPESDARQYHVDERTPESAPRKKRRAAHGPR